MVLLLYVHVEPGEQEKCVLIRTLFMHLVYAHVLVPPVEYYNPKWLTEVFGSLKLFLHL